MTATIVYPTALEYWLEEKGIPYRSELYHLDPKEFIGRKGILDITEYLNFTQPIHIAVPSHINRRPAEGILFHTLPDRLPKGSFFSVCDLLQISSPEFCFLQAAQVLPIHMLVHLAMDLCAKYLKDPYENTFQRSRDPVTSVESIQKFLNNASGFKGVNRAKQAIAFALNNSNSPMESNLATLARLGCSYGGFGTKGQLLNYDVKLMKKGAEYLGRESCCCDMVWPKEKIVLEYDSNLTHLSRERHALDKRRSTALSMSGYRVISVTADKVHSFRGIEELFWGIRRMLGMKTGRTEMERYFEKRWKVVHEIMGIRN